MAVESGTAWSLKRIAKATVILAILATAVGMYLARPFLVPIAFSVLFASLLDPLVRRLRRIHVPAPVAATLVIVACLAVLAAAGFGLQKPMSDLMSELPRSLAKARAKLTQMSAPLAKVGINPFGPSARPAPKSATRRATPTSGADSTKQPDSAKQPDAAKQPDSSSSAAATLDSQPKGDSASTRTAAPYSQRAGAGARSGSSAPPDVTAAAGEAFGATLSVLAEFVTVLLLTLLLLAAGDAWVKKVEDAINSPERHTRTREAVTKMRAVVTRYMLVTALINLGQGVLVALVAWWVGLPSPVLWGVLTFIAEFIPYLGGAAMVVLLALAGLGGTGSFLHALIAPGAYLVITTLQNNVVSPVAYGKGLRLNAAMILVSVLIWYTVWGIAGVFLAVPIMACVRILSEYIAVLKPLGVLLEE